MSRATVKGISASAGGGFFLHEKQPDQEVKEEDKDAHLAAIREVWRTFNVSDEVVELEKKDLSSQVFSSGLCFVAFLTERKLTLGSRRDSSPNSQTRTLLCAVINALSMYPTGTSH